MSSKKSATTEAAEEVVEEVVTETTEDATAETTQEAETTEPVAYVGPSIPGVAMHNTFYTNGEVTQALKDAAAKEPIFNSLIVPLSKLAAATAEIEGKSGATYVLYQRAKQYKV